jgi:hypothetical protein
MILKIDRRKGVTMIRSNTRFVVAITLGLFIVSQHIGCSSESSMSVPIDCKRFLDSFFEAARSKDVERVRQLSFYLGNQDVPQSDEILETRKTMSAHTFEGMLTTFGDIKGYSVLSMQENTIYESNQDQSDKPRLGTYADVICKVKCSNKRQAKITFKLFKNPTTSEYDLVSWQYQSER